MNKTENYVDNPFKSPAILSLCTGMRGLERGLENAIGSLWGVFRDKADQVRADNHNPVKIAAYVEIEAFIDWNVVKQMEQGVLDPVPVWTDLKTFPWEYFRRKIFMFTGGYPCQPFSTAGKQKGKEDPRHLWPFIADGIAIVRPPVCFFENVANHLNLGYETVRRDLQRMGYQVEEGIYSAEEVGSPHRRERLFILAVDNSCINRLKQEYQVSTRWNSTEHAGEELANTNNEGSQGWNSGELQECSRKCTARTSSAFSWPARPGEPQYDWEPPRIESSMGYVLNGYDFREDLLRMAGNGVVEQTAEVAFIDLLRKHFQVKA